MWSSWFPNGIIPSKRGSNANLQQRIRGLFEAKVTPKDCSPMLKELQTHKNNVRRISSVYEGNIKVYNEKSASFIRKPTFVDAQNKIDHGVEPEINHQPILGESHSKRSVPNSINLLVQSDADFIKHTEFLISTYVKEFEALPALRLKNEASITTRQKQELFGQIERIYELHRDIFHPILLSCGLDVVKFGRKLSEMCSARNFNVYLVHALDEKDCDFRRKVYYKYFMQSITDKIGIAFEFAPIQQLARYHLIIIEILNKLKKESASNEEIEAMTKAEADWKALMVQIYSMRNFATI